MPVYHISNFDVSAVQIDLSANIFTADTSITADYWVWLRVTFNDSNTNSIQSDASLNYLFKNIMLTPFSTLNVSAVWSTRLIGGRSTTFATAFAGSALSSLIKFKDLGIIDKNTDQLFSGSIYNIGNLTANNASTYPESFIGKVHNVLSNKDFITGLRERMMASINVGSNPDVDLGINQNVPVGSQFGFQIVRILNLAGTSQDQTAIIGVVLEQDS
jgi:hypothetical protein